ncbi:predicted protein [Histoplasma capsulatum H143]|uniref:Uncharacterized protein n=1 Tax=Ajellomyces capsulatus (strain H143) TaxID=544712 RepID=C6HKH0_AJECH|nr:predicted protein [Histoplasma capsulatum H143]
MAPNTSQSIEDGRKEEENGSRNHIRWIRKDAEPLDDAHNKVHENAHEVCGEAADERIEFRRGWADSQEVGDFNEDQYEQTDTDMIVLVTSKKISSRNTESSSIAITNL